jgi:hypothetical protein
MRWAGFGGIERLVAGLLGLLALCAGAPATAVNGTVLWYLEQEAGSEPYRVRYLVTAEFLRSDDGNDGDDFVLLDRAQRQIYNVVPETASVLVIDGRGAAPEAPAALSLDVQETVDAQAPKLEGRQPLTVVLSADGDVCQSAVVVPGLLDDVRAAFQEFAQVLAVQQARTLSNMPVEFQTPCVLGRDVYAGDFHLGAGLPLLEWADKGTRRELLKYERNVPLAATLFAVPDDLRVYRVQTGNSGGGEDWTDP